MTGAGTNVLALSTADGLVLVDSGTPELVSALGAALATKNEGKQFRSRVQLLLASIVPNLPDFDAQLSAEEQLSRAVESNVRWTVRQILSTPEGQARAQEGRMKIVGAVYAIESGRVRFLPGG